MSRITDMLLNDTTESHPWNWWVPSGTTTLFIGTFPPIKSRWSYEFFYPNAQNFFWGILAEIAGVQLQNSSLSEVELRKHILELLKCGITDMGKKIKRMKNNSADESLLLLEAMEILEILKTHPSIEKLILTSSSGPVSSLRWFTSYLTSRNVVHAIPKGTKPLKFVINIRDRPIKVVVVYSPSRRAANRIGFSELVKMYRDAIQTW